MIVQYFFKFFCLIYDLLWRKIIHIGYSIIIMKLDSIKAELFIQCKFIPELD